MNAENAAWPKWAEKRQLGTVKAGKLRKKADREGGKRCFSRQEQVTKTIIKALETSGWQFLSDFMPPRALRTSGSVG